MNYYLNQRINRITPTLSQDFSSPSLTLPPISPSHKLNTLTEEPIFLNDNDTRLKAYSNYIQNKMTTIDERAENYLTYMYRSKHKKEKNENTPVRSPSLDSSMFTPGYVKSKMSDITNPNYFCANSYNKLQLKKREYLNYNYINGEKNYFNRKKRVNSEESIIPNPYNDLHCNVYSLGSSKLQHNPILNPLPNFEYNKYLNRNIYLKQ